MVKEELKVTEQTKGKSSDEYKELDLTREGIVKDRKKLRNQISAMNSRISQKTGVD